MADMGAAVSGPLTLGLMCSVAPESSTVLDPSSCPAVTYALAAGSTWLICSVSSVPGMRREPFSGFGTPPTRTMTVSHPGTCTGTTTGISTSTTISGSDNGNGTGRGGPGMAS